MRACGPLDGLRCRRDGEAPRHGPGARRAVVVAIGDTGGAIPDHVRPKILDPFFTTKEVGRGSGQGLPLVRGVVCEGHGGSITLDSTLGVGSTFTLRLPIDGKP